jgi:hypothetical protein
MPGVPVTQGLIYLRSKLQRLLQQTVTSQPLQGHRQHAGIQQFDPDNPIAIGILPGLRPQRVTLFQLLPEGVVQHRVTRNEGRFSRRSSHRYLSGHLPAVLRDIGHDREDDFRVLLAEGKGSDQNSGKGAGTCHWSGPRPVHKSEEGMRRWSHEREAVPGVSCIGWPLQYAERSPRLQVTGLMIP